MIRAQGMRGLHNSMSAELTGGLLREWRRRRRMSQLDLACDADISTKHLSFLETRRSRPSREMLQHLAECLDVPLRVRNTMLSAAGFEPVFPQRTFDDPALAFARRDVDTILAAHEPNPAMALDRHWVILSANSAVASLVAGAEPIVLRPPVNLLRLCLHPAGLASRIVNLIEWRAQIVARLRRQIEASGDTGLIDLLEEIRNYPRPPESGSSLSRLIGSRPLGSGSRSIRSRDVGDTLHGIAIPLQLVTIDGTLSFFSATTRFGMPADITLSELTIEAFLPADQPTAEILQRNAQRAPTPERLASADEDRRFGARA
jgi:transcriptional regulator with XRE-family HTH domain